MPSNVAPLHRPSAKGSGLRDEWRVGQWGLPVARYIDKDFARLEAEMLWPHVWQMAAREDQLPEPGDFCVYDILDKSVVLVRRPDGSVKSFLNACPHRGTMLALGEGRFQLDTIVCPFHGWRWRTDGENVYIPNRSEFHDGCLNADDVSLVPVRTEQWAGSIWINLDPDARPLAEHMGPAKALIDGLHFEKMKFHWHQHAVINCNWKVAQEAFMEAYHVPQSHPQFVRGSNWDDFNSVFTYERVGKGHGLFKVGALHTAGHSTREMLLARDKNTQVDDLVHGLLLLYEGQDAQIQAEEVAVARSMRNREIPPGMTVDEAFVDVLRAHYEAQGRFMASNEALSRVFDMHLFPHITFLPTYGNLLMYRARPSPNNDPDFCLFDMYAFRTYPDGQQPPKWRTQNCTTPSEFSLIPSQDFGAITRVQKGLHSGRSHTQMGARQEIEIWSMHEELDVYLETGAGS